MVPRAIYDHFSKARINKVQHYTIITRSDIGIHSKEVLRPERKFKYLFFAKNIEAISSTLFLLDAAIIEESIQLHESLDKEEVVFEIELATVMQFWFMAKKTQNHFTPNKEDL